MLGPLCRATASSGVVYVARVPALPRTLDRRCRARCRPVVTMRTEWWHVSQFGHVEGHADPETYETVELAPVNRDRSPLPACAFHEFESGWRTVEGLFAVVVNARGQHARLARPDTSRHCLFIISPVAQHLSTAGGTDGHRSCSHLPRVAPSPRCGDVMELLGRARCNQTRSRSLRCSSRRSTRPSTASWPRQPIRRAADRRKRGTGSLLSHPCSDRSPWHRQSSRLCPLSAHISSEFCQSKHVLTCLNVPTFRGFRGRSPSSCDLR